MSGNLAGKTAIVTGASSGIGEATTRLLVAAGCNTVLAARHEDIACAPSRRSSESAPSPCRPTDVTDPAACEGLVESTVERFGSLDALVTNAGPGISGSVS